MSPLLELVGFFSEFSLDFGRARSGINGGWGREDAEVLGEVGGVPVGKVGEVVEAKALVLVIVSKQQRGPLARRTGINMDRVVW